MRGLVAAVAALLAIGLAAPARADRDDAPNDDDDAQPIGSDRAGADVAPSPGGDASAHPHRRLDTASKRQATDAEVDTARHAAIDDEYQRHLPRDGYEAMGDDDYSVPVPRLDPSLDPGAHPGPRAKPWRSPFDDGEDDDGADDDGGSGGPRRWRSHPTAGGQGSGSGAGGSGAGGSGANGRLPVPPNAGSGSAGDSRTAAPPDDRFGGRHRSAGGNLPGDREDRRDPDRRYRYDGGDDRETSVGSFMTWVMWGIVIVVILLVLFWVANELTRADAEAELAPAEVKPDVTAIVDAVIDRPLGDADEFAHHGDYAEAIHTLLLRTLQELARSAAVRVQPANTSREILAKVPLLADARDALAGLITTVELTHFGDEPANAADYERCIRQFQVFAAAFRGGLGGGPSRAVRA